MLYLSMPFTLARFYHILHPLKPFIQLLLSPVAYLLNQMSGVIPPILTYRTKLWGTELTYLRSK